MNGNETHVMDDDTEHNAHECPTGCTVRSGLERLLAQLDSGEYEFVRVQ